MTNGSWLMLAFAALIAGCHRTPAGENAIAAAPTASMTAVGKDADASYVTHVLHDTAIDFGACRQSPAMQGMSGAAALSEAIVAIDSSGSMAGRSGPGTKMDEARAAVTQFIEALPVDTGVGVLVFGDTGDNRQASKGPSCAANPHFLFGPAAVNRAQVAGALADLRPAGWTPLAAAIRSAAVRFTGPAGSRRTMFVVSDGNETCGGDPIAAARDAHGSGGVTVNVIGFGVGAPAEVAALRRVADAGGGSYQDAGPGQLLLTLKSQAAGAKAANMGAVLKAETSMEGCYTANIRREHDRLISRINADQAGGKINQATHSAAVEANSKRFDADMADFLRVHNANLARERAAREQMEGAVVNAATKD